MVLMVEQLASRRVVFRTTKLMEYGLKLAFVFERQMPPLKQKSANGESTELEAEEDTKKRLQKRMLPNEEICCSNVSTHARNCG